MLTSSQRSVRLLLMAAAVGAIAATAAAGDIAFPADAGALNVKADYGAKGDGVTDDTAGIQKAIVTALSGDYRNPRPVYLPAGTYLISGSLKARITDAADGQGGWSDGWRSGIFLVGESRQRTVLRLKDRCMVCRGYYTTANIITHRREPMALNGKLLTPRILEKYRYVDKKGRVYNDVGLLVGEGKPKGKPGYTYEGFAGADVLKPGEFGVAELGPGDARYKGHEHKHPNSLFLRLPDGVKTLEGAAVEVGFAPTLLRIRNKQSVVLRNLVFRHAASWYLNHFDTAAVDIGFDPVVAKHAYELDLNPLNYVIDRCVFEDNNGTGLQTRGMDRFAVRHCTMRNNGKEGVSLSHARNGVVEDVEVTANNRLGWLGGLDHTPHGGGGVNLSAMDVLFRRLRSHHNHGAGLGGDVIATNLIFEDCEFSHNANRGHWHKISWGPILLKRCRFVGNGNMGFFILNTHDVTLDECVIADNARSQFGFSHSDVRESPPTFEAALTGHGGGPNQWSTGFALRNSIVVRRDDQHMFERISASQKLYQKWVEQEYTGEGNTFWNADSTGVFDTTGRYNGREFVDFASWQKATGSDANSRWAPPKEMPVK